MIVCLQIFLSELDKVLSSARKRTKLRKVAKAITLKETIFDNKRFMAHLAINKTTNKVVKTLTKKLKAYLKMITLEDIMQVFRILVSLPGRQDQLNYRDFAENFISLIERKELNYYSSILALMNDTYININSHRKVLILKMHFFHHNVIYSGYSYEK